MAPSTGLRLLALSLLVLGASSSLAATLTDISFSSKPGNRFEIKLDFDSLPPEFKAYTIEKPARISMDFLDVSSALKQKKFDVPFGNATGVVVLESGNRTRMIINLVELLPYATRVDNNTLYVEVGEQGIKNYHKEISSSSAVARAEQQAASR